MGLRVPTEAVGSGEYLLIVESEPAHEQGLGAVVHHQRDVYLRGGDD
jgi:hypothetical protein